MQISKNFRVSCFKGCIAKNLRKACTHLLMKELWQTQYQQIFYSCKSVVQMLNQIYANIQTWWSSKQPNIIDKNKNQLGHAICFMPRERQNLVTIANLHSYREIVNCFWRKIDIWLNQGAVTQHGNEFKKQEIKDISFSLYVGLIAYWNWLISHFRDVKLFVEFSTGTHVSFVAIIPRELTLEWLFVLEATQKRRLLLFSPQWANAHAWPSMICVSCFSAENSCILPTLFLQLLAVIP